MIATLAALAAVPAWAQEPVAGMAAPWLTGAGDAGSSALAEKPAWSSAASEAYAPGAAPWLSSTAGPAVSTETPRGRLERDWSWPRLSGDLELLLRARRGLDADLREMRASAAFQAPDRRDRELYVDEREAAVALWRRFVDRLIALDTLVSRYNKFEEVGDPGRRRAAFVAAHAAFAAQTRAARAWVAAASEPELVRSFEAAQPDLGLPARSLEALRSSLPARRAVLAEAKAYAALSREGLRGLRQLGAAAARVLASIADDTRELRPPAAAGSTAGVPEFAPLWPDPLSFAGEWTGPDPRPPEEAPKEERLLLDESAEAPATFREQLARWFPGISTGPRPSALTAPEQLDELRGALQPGDLLLMRRERHIGEPGLGGWWHGAGLYLGTPEERRRAGGSDALDVEINARVPSAYWRSLRTDEDGRPMRLLSALPGGVRLQSLERGAAADSVAALRPRLPRAQRLAAVLRAFEAEGRPYDEAFDPADPSAIYSLELLLVAYPGLRIDPRPLHQAGPPGPGDLARTFDAWYGLDVEPLELVYFLDGQESRGRAAVRGVAEFRGTWRRPRWSFTRRAEAAEPQQGEGPSEKPQPRGQARAPAGLGVVDAETRGGGIAPPGLGDKGSTETGGHAARPQENNHVTPASLPQAPAQAE
ncbi:MAG: hypothetical protein HY554_18445 [Elusimicrobia bacterium]|nr:hypothetical protein [Elusimicrobiota bacterium]